MLIPLLALFPVLSIPLFAQGNTITRNPKCVQLKRIWKLEGKEKDDQLGGATGSVGDINGDGLGDFAVMHHLPPEWMVFYGSRDSISTTPVWANEGGSYEIDRPVVGDFWGTGHKAVGFARSRIVDLNTYRQADWLHIYRTDSNRLDTIPSIIWSSVSWKDTSLRAKIVDALAADLDGDGDDELIIAHKWVTIEGRYGQIWIYEGGANFQMDTPSVVIKDPELNDDFYRIHAGDIDGDGRIDLMSVKYVAYSGGLTKADFYWSGNGWPSTGRLPDRSVVTGDPQERDGANRAMLADCDGDGVMDVVSSVARICAPAAARIHTRGTGHSPMPISI